MSPYYKKGTKHFVFCLFILNFAYCIVRTRIITYYKTNDN